MKRELKQKIYLLPTLFLLSAFLSAAAFATFRSFCKTFSVIFRLDERFLCRILPFKGCVLDVEETSSGTLVKYSGSCIHRNTEVFVRTVTNKTVKRKLRKFPSSLFLCVFVCLNLTYLQCVCVCEQMQTRSESDWIVIASHGKAWSLTSLLMGGYRRGLIPSCVYIGLNQRSPLYPLPR